MATFNILCIDGGGLRGLIPLRILQKVEELTGKNVQDTFDMMAGTSTGGLIVSCLTLRDKADSSRPRYGLDDIIAIYVKKGSTIFPVKSGFGNFVRKAANLFRPAFSKDGIDRVLHSYMEDQRVGEAFRPILVSTYDLHGNQPVFFKSSEADGDETANAKVYDVCRATSAAPTYLPAYSFPYKGRTLTGIDGGVYVNNPTMAAIAEISKYGSAGFYHKRDGTSVTFDDIRVLSLGTGTYTGQITREEAVKWGELQWVTRITDIMMRGVNQSTDYESAEMLDKGKYLRINIDIPDEKYADMADAREATRAYLEGLVRGQVTDNEDMMKKLKTFLAGLG